MTEQRQREGWVEGLFDKAKLVPFDYALTKLGIENLQRASEMQLQGTCVLPKCGKSKDTLGINLELQAFHCFACKRSGDVIKFVSLYKGIGGKDAALWLVGLERAEGAGDNENERLKEAANTESREQSKAVEVTGNGAGVVAGISVASNGQHEMHHNDQAGQEEDTTSQVARFQRRVKVRVVMAFVSDPLVELFKGDDDPVELAREIAADIIGFAQGVVRQKQRE